MGNCTNCVYWTTVRNNAGQGTSEGRCRRCCPSPAFVREHNNAVWPITKWDDSCGEFHGGNSPDESAVAPKFVEWEDDIEPNGC